MFDMYLGFNAAMTPLNLELEPPISYRMDILTVEL
jgi:hypothetical protein